MTPFFPSEWDNDPQFIYLGSEANPKTGRKYDYYLLDQGEEVEKNFPGCRYEWTARHGPEAPDYGSGMLIISCYDKTHLCPHSDDFIFGSTRAQQLSLYYLAFGIKPLLEKETM